MYIYIYTHINKYIFHTFPPDIYRNWLLPPRCESSLETYLEACDMMMSIPWRDQLCSRSQEILNSKGCGSSMGPWFFQGTLRHFDE